jgi:hypothetical protein
MTLKDTGGLLLPAASFAVHVTRVTPTGKPVPPSVTSTSAPPPPSGARHVTGGGLAPASVGSIEGKPTWAVGEPAGAAA